MKESLCLLFPPPPCRRCCCRRYCRRRRHHYHHHDAHASTYTHTHILLTQAAAFEGTIEASPDAEPPK